MKSNYLLIIAFVAPGFLSAINRPNGRFLAIVTIRVTRAIPQCTIRLRLSSDNAHYIRAGVAGVRERERDSSILPTE